MQRPHLTEQELTAIDYMQQVVDLSHVTIALSPEVSLREAELIYLGAVIQENAHNQEKMKQFATRVFGGNPTPMGFGGPQWLLTTMAQAVAGLRSEKEMYMREIDDKLK